MNAKKKAAQPDPNFSGGGFRNSDGEWVPAEKSASYRLHLIKQLREVEEARRKAEEEPAK